MTDDTGDDNVPQKDPAADESVDTPEYGLDESLRQTGPLQKISPDTTRPLNTTPKRDRMSFMRRTFNLRQLKRRFGNKRTRLQVLSTAALIGLGGVVAGLLLVGILFAWYAKDLPRPDKVRRVEGLSIEVLDREGVNLYDIFEDENRKPVDFATLPEHLKNATIAVEDKDFYTHQGVSTTGIARSVVNIVLFGNIQGGSTLTQQLVKNVLLTSERTLPRKIKEAILAIQIERKYDKDQILQMYLNEAPYGGTAVGVESASQYYFAKPASELTLIESVILAGLPQSPTRYSPFTGGEDAYVWRAEQVLRRMREDGYITKEQEEEVKTQLPEVEFAGGEEGLKAPHFVAYVREQLIEKFGDDVVETGGLTVTTTLDWELQQEAQEIVREEIEEVANLDVSNGAAVVMDPKTGEILAMIGSKDYAATDSGGYKFNVAVQGLRQPGSTMKPITYAAAFAKGYTASTLLFDVVTTYPGGTGQKDYVPKNYDLKYRGPTHLRYALGNSVNTIAVKVSALVGVEEVLDLAYNMGLSTLEPTAENLSRFGLSLTLGGGEVTLLDLTSAFGVFAAGGERVEPVAILKVVDSGGKTLFEYKPPKPKRVLDEGIAYIISDILSDNDARKAVFGPNSYLVIPGHSVAVKTGTTDDKRDNWTVGYSQSVVVGVWVGNNDNSPMHPSLASGVTGAAPIWNRIIKAALDGKSNEPFEKPSSIVEMEIDALGGGLPVEGQATRTEVYIKGTEPTGPADIYQKIKVSDHDDTKLANRIEIAKGEYDEKTFIVFTENDPVSGDGKNRWQEAIDAWLKDRDDPLYHPPTEEYSGDNAQISVKIREPNDRQRIDKNTVKIAIDATSVNDIKKIELYVNGVLEADKNDKSLSMEIELENGTYTLRARTEDNKGNVANEEIKIGVNMPWDGQVQGTTDDTTPTPTATPTPTP